jgi:DNA-binding NarL/FixJ family response regulator
MAVRLLESRADVDIDEWLPRVTTPTLVVHARKDGVAPFDEGKRLAAAIPGAQFVALDSKNHVLLEDEPAWERFRDALFDFVGVKGTAGEDVAFAKLSQRERTVLSLVAEGLGNADIALRLELSEKTVRNHVTNMFDKLGVWTRAQAIVFARERGFRG